MQPVVRIFSFIGGRPLSADRLQIMLHRWKRYLVPKVAIAEHKDVDEGIERLARFHAQLCRV